ncbi:MAG TPA: hypothetical protein VGN14_10755 [Candidatus Elarobacter sp.]
MGWGHRRVRQLLRKLAVPGDLRGDDLAEAVWRSSGGESPRAAVLDVVDRALSSYPAIYATIVRRVDVDGEPALGVARRLQLSERTFFRYRGTAVGAVAAALDVALNGARGDEPREVDLDALALYARGRSAMRVRSRRSLQRAIGYFTRAVELAPEFAKAHAALADAHVVLGGSLLYDTRAEFGSAHAALERAVGLNAKLPDVHAALADLYFYEQHDRRRARDEVDLALALDPNFFGALRLRALIALSERDADGLFEHLRNALARAPESLELQTLLGVAHVNAGSAERGIAQLLEIVELNPDFPLARYELARALVRCNRFADAAAHLTALIAAEERPAFEATLAYAEAFAGDPRRARRFLGDPHPSVAGNAYLRSWLHVALGEVPAALSALEEAVRRGEPWSVWIASDSFLAPLRNEPRFRQLVAALAEPSAPVPRAC